MRINTSLLSQYLMDEIFFSLGWMVDLVLFGAFCGMREKERQGEIKLKERCKILDGIAKICRNKEMKKV